MPNRMQGAARANRHAAHAEGAVRLFEFHTAVWSAMRHCQRLAAPVIGLPEGIEGGKQVFPFVPFERLLQQGNGGLAGNRLTSICVKQSNTIGSKTSARQEHCGARQLPLNQRTDAFGGIVAQRDAHRTGAIGEGGEPAFDT